MRLPDTSPVLDKNRAPWVQKCYPVVGLGSGERLLWHFQTPALYWVNFSLRVLATLPNLFPRGSLEGSSKGHKKRNGLGGRQAVPRRGGRNLQSSVEFSFWAKALFLAYLVPQICLKQWRTAFFDPKPQDQNCSCVWSQKHENTPNHGNFPSSEEISGENNSKNNFSMVSRKQGLSLLLLLHRFGKG